MGLVEPPVDVARGNAGLFEARRSLIRLPLESPIARRHRGDDLGGCLVIWLVVTGKKRPGSHCLEMGEKKRATLRLVRDLDFEKTMMRTADFSRVTDANSQLFALFGFPSEQNAKGFGSVRQTQEADCPPAV